MNSYCYTVSDLLLDRQERCVSDNPTDVAAGLDKLMANMCTDKVSKETGMDLRNSALQPTSPGFPADCDMIAPSGVLGRPMSSQQGFAAARF